jgi:hypothetical protein
MKFIKIKHTEILKKIVTLEGTYGLIKNDKTRVLGAKVYGMYVFCLLHKFKQFANHILYPRKTRHIEAKGVFFPRISQIIDFR